MLLYTFLVSETADVQTSIDWSAVAAWIALAVAIISPIITAIINNFHESKMKRIEIIKNRGLDVIENYLSVVSREIYILGVSDNYNKCYSLIFLYAPKSLHKSIEELDSLIRSSGSKQFPDANKCQALLITISKALQYDKL